jgi:hypothetical protein
MNASPASQKTASFLGVLGAFLVVGALVWAMRHYTRPPAPNQARVEERKTALAELRAAEAEALHNYGWVDQGKGLVRLKEDRAMELTVAEYQNPAGARTNLVARAEKAAAPPPKAPEKPSQYE